MSTKRGGEAIQFAERRTKMLGRDTTADAMSKKITQKVKAE